MKLSSLLLVCFFLLIPACYAMAQSADQQFDELTADFLKGYFAANPIAATGIGVHDFDNILDDVGAAAVEKEAARLKAFKAHLEQTDQASLSKDKNIDFRILTENIDESLFGLEELREFEWNPMVYTGALGNSIASLIYQEFAPLDKRLKNAAARATEVPRFLEQAKTNLKNAPLIHVATAIRQNQGSISLFKDELPKAANGASPDLRSEVSDASAKAVAALEDFGKWLETDLKPRATKESRLGKALFDKKLTHALKSKLTPDQVLQRAETENVRVHREMYALAAPLFKEYYGEGVSGTDTLAVIKMVLDKIVLDHPKKDELMDVIKKVIPDLEEFITKKELLTLDQAQPLVIRETPEYERGVAVASMESPGPLEKNLKSFYNVTPIPDDWTPEQVESYLREYNNWSIRELSIHEGVPGHYVQAYYANRCPSILRNVYGSGSMVEGWAMYAERMMIEQGYMDNDPRMKLINLKWYIRCVLNAIIDQKIHAYGMTEKDMMDLLTKQGFQEEREAAGKWRRANLTSAQLSTYFVGFQEIWDLREAYKQKMGQAFSVKKFHEEFLSHGSPTVKYIQELMLGE